MESKYLFENEQLLTESDNKEFILTTHRVRQITNQFGKASVTSILLEKVSSIEVNYKSNIWLLILGIITIPIVIGIILIILYYTSRKHCIAISSDSGVSINIETKWLKHDAILDLINKVESAQNKRLMN